MEIFTAPLYIVSHQDFAKVLSVAFSFLPWGWPNFFFFCYYCNCFFFFFPFYWSIVALQCCVSFCSTAKWVSYKFSSVQSLSHVRLFVTPWTAARQASLSITNSQSLLRFMSIKSVMPSNHLILCRPLLLIPSIFPSIRAFASESVLHILWPKHWSFSFSISPSNEYSGLTSFRMDWFDLKWPFGFLFPGI